MSNYDPWGAFAKNMISMMKYGDALNKQEEDELYESASPFIENIIKTKAQAKEIESEASYIIETLGLDGDGSNSAMPMVYETLMAFRNSKNRVKDATEAIKERGIKEVNFNPEARTTTVEEQTNEALSTKPDTKVKTTSIEPKRTTEKNALGETVDIKTEKKENTFFNTLFDEDNRVSAKALKRLQAKYGVEAVASAADVYGGGSILDPTRFYVTDPKNKEAGPMPYPKGVSPLLVYQIPQLGENWTQERLLDLATTPAKLDATIDALNPDTKQRVYLMEYRDNLIRQQKIRGFQDGTSEGLASAAVNSAMVEAGLLNEDGTTLELSAVKERHPQIDNKEEYFSFLEFKKKQFKGEDPVEKIFSEATSLSKARSSKEEIQGLKGIIPIEQYQNSIDRIDRLITDFTGDRPVATDAQLSKITLFDENANALTDATLDLSTGYITLPNGMRFKHGDETYFGTETPINYAIGRIESLETATKFASSYKEATKGYFDINQGYSQAVSNFANMVEIADDFPDTLNPAGKISATLTKNFKALQFFFNAVGDKKADASLVGLQKYIGEGHEGADDLLSVSDGRSFIERASDSLFGGAAEQVSDLANANARFESLKINAAYTLARARGQAGRNLSDADLQFQLQSIIGASNPETLREVLTQITLDVIDDVDAQRTVAVAKLYNTSKPLTDGKIELKEDWITEQFDEGSRVKMWVTRALLIKRDGGHVTLEERMKRSLNEPIDLPRSSNVGTDDEAALIKAYGRYMTGQPDGLQVVLSLSKEEQIKKARELRAKGKL